MQPLVITGARTIVTIDQRTIAAGYVLNYSLGTDHAPLYHLDSPIPAELYPERTTVNLDLRVYRLPDNDPVLLGIAPPTDGSQLYTERKYITVEVRDKKTDQTILYIPKAVIVRRSGGVSSESTASENWSIIGIANRPPTSQRTGILGSLGI